jgi:hypothetical protein
LKRYRNLSREESGYEIGDDHIMVRFRGGKAYRYSHAGAGREHVERMKECAVEGRGLGTCISQHVHDRYDRK